VRAEVATTTRHTGGAHGAECKHDHIARATAAQTRGLRTALIITAAFFFAEVIGGLVSNSLALLADAGHMLTDVGALALSLFVAWFSRQPGRPEKTYGYLRWEILAALMNGAALLLISVWIAIEAVMRFRSPEPLASGLMLTVAVAGLAVNAAAAWILHPTGQTSLNVRGAYLHVVGDLLASVGTVAAAILVRYTGWLAADPAASLLSTALIIRGAWRLVSESVDVLLEAAPRHITVSEVRSRLEAIPNVESVHDLHVWTVTSGMIAMSAHVIVRESEQHQAVLELAHDTMQELGIQHVTLQLECREMYERELHLHP
jgi:cobalt-zinc-cadmium efflux system protein